MGSRKILLSLAGNSARILPDSYKRAIYQNPSFSKVIRRGLNFAAPEGLSEVTIASGQLEGMQILVDLQAEKDYWLGTYEPDLQTAVAGLVIPGQVIYDIGASIGYMTLLLAKNSGEEGHVFAFEALPANITRLKQNLELNSLAERVTVVHAAVQDRSERTEFLQGPSPAMGKVGRSAGRSAVQYSMVIEVDGVAIDDFIFEKGNPIPDLLKIDIEGGEILALPGMSRLLGESHPTLFVELHGPEAAKTTWQILEDKRYRICQMKPGYPQVARVEDLDWKSYLVAFGYG